MEKKTVRQIVFVCTGNTCRSPMAEILLKYELRRRGEQDVEVSSAGIKVDFSSTHIHPLSLKTLEEHGFSAENFEPKQLSDKMLKKAYRIICMTDTQRDVVSDVRWNALTEKQRERATQNVYSFSDVCGYEIPDPYGKGETAYQKTYEKLSEAMSTVADFCLERRKSGRKKKS